MRNVSTTSANWKSGSPKAQHTCAVVKGQDGGFMESSSCLTHIPYVCERVPLDVSPDNRCVASIGGNLIRSSVRNRRSNSLNFSSTRIT